MSLPITLPITGAYRQQAQRFAQQQVNREKAARIYLNTLAVLVVRNYLELLDVPTDLGASYSWSGMGRMCADVADLVVANVGRLECRPMRSGQQNCLVPPEVWQDRIGYVVVQIDDGYRQGTIVGFTASVSDKILPLARLQPLDSLLVTLHNAPRSLLVTDLLTPLSRWFDQIFEPSWQAVEDLLNPVQANLAFQFRTMTEGGETSTRLSAAGVRRAKLINLGLQLADQSVVLLIEIRPESDGAIGVLLQVHPGGNRKFLPSGLQLILLDQKGRAASTVQAREMDNYIQLKFGGQPREMFGITLSLDQFTLTETFEI